MSPRKRRTTCGVPKKKKHRNPIRKRTQWNTQARKNMVVKAHEIKSNISPIRWMKKFWNKFRSILVHKNPNRHQRRTAVRNYIKEHKNKNIAAFNLARTRAKKKYTNRRNRKQTHAMHRRCRVGAYA